MPTKLFQKGMPRPANAGRKKGSKNKKTGEIQSYSQRLLNDRVFRKNLRAGVQNLTVDPSIIRMLFQYGFGRPPEKIELSGPDGGPMEAVVRIYLPDNGRKPQG